ncbi:hypothetical protein [Qipengyuania sp. RANM35]|uniref:hypothetical protein n=1 Tax=Qipengyuania sp. RANM35 TaxID=3068635 RepID=UPI0034DAE060
MPTAPKISRSSLHLAAGWVGVVAIAFMWARKADVLSGTVGTIWGMLFVLTVLVLFVTRNADEYVAALWRAGAGAAFIALIAWELFGPAMEGFIDGLAGVEDNMDFPASAGPAVAYTAFFVAHTWARIRGTY